MKVRFHALLALALLALGATQLSCNVNDYCLNCGTGDAGSGSGNGDANDANTDIDASIDAGCEPTGPETCDGIDNDCNGLVDDGTVEGTNQLCGDQDGSCSGATTFCQATTGCDATPGCNPQSATSNCCMKCTKNPSPEVCDFVDNNCNSMTDEGDPGGGGVCGTAQGECVAGQLRCQAVSGCNPAIACDATVVGNNCCIKCTNFVDHRADPELCNGKDDNCNGGIDELLTNLGACTWAGATDVGECVIGTLSCVGGNPQCNGAVFPAFEVCNNLNDDCDASTDEIFNKNIDPVNCGMCGNPTTGAGICLAKSKTCEGGTNARMPCTCTSGTDCTSDPECPGSKCVVNSQPCCGPTCNVNNPNGTCGFKCNVGFIDLNGTMTDGCEYKCSPSGNEECDGIDNDCDGLIDALDPQLVTPPGLCLTLGVCTGSTASCMASSGWVCNYPSSYESAGEVSCDGLNNDCDANIDESHPEKGLACDDDQAGICLDTGMNFCNTADPDGALVCSKAFEKGTQCQNNTDDNADGVINEGCEVVGAAPETGSACGDTMDQDNDGRVNDGCPAAALPNTPMGSENCNAKDDDCDGITDEATAGVLPGQDWVSLANGVQMMKYEASRPDATIAIAGIGNAIACSRSGVLPWTNITYPQAVAECTAIGARLCTESEWHHACSVVPTPAALTFGVSTAAATFIEAEDYTSIAHATDTAANPDITRAWVHDYTGGTASYSSISAMEATPNTVGGNVTLANAPTQAPLLSYALNVTQAAANYHVWVKMYQTGFAGNNDVAYVQIPTATPATLVTVTAPAPIACTMDSQCTALKGGTCVDLDANNVKDFCAGYVWIDAGTFNIPMAAATLNLYMGDDGVKIDKLAINNSASAPVDTDIGEGNIWAFSTSPNVANDTTCNGHERTSANDDVIPSGTLPMCFADNASTNDMFDMSGNVKEWTRAQQPGVNPLRGGASNNTTAGLACPLNFTVADDELQFPNIGFRCCK